MSSPQREVEAAQHRLYWERNAGPTCGILILLVALSALASPISWHLLLFCVGGGATLYLTELPFIRSRPAISVILALLAIGLGLAGAVAGGVVKGSLFWVQVVGTFFAAKLAAKLLHEGASEESSSEKPGVPPQ